MNIRLSQFMAAEKINSAKLAEILEIQPSSISHLLSGRNKPSFDFISRLMMMFPELNPDWIINGGGTMYRSENITQPQIVTELNNDLDNLDNDTINQADTKVIDVNPISVDEPVSEPITKDNNPQIEKIILFYSDNTFDVSTRRK